MSLRQLVSSTVVHELQCTINRYGHSEPIPPGRFVECVYKQANVRMYPELAIDTSARDQSMGLPMCEAGIGSVLGHTWHIDPHGLLNIEFEHMDIGRSFTSIPHITKPTREMYYLVSFHRGMFYARYDWIIELTEAPTAQKV